MRAFALYDSSKRHRKPCAWILYQPATEAFTIELASWAGPLDLPLGLAAYALEDPLKPAASGPGLSRKSTQDRTTSGSGEHINAALAHSPEPTERIQETPLEPTEHDQEASAREAEPRVIPSYAAQQWLETRIPPANRENIRHVLAAHGLDEYYAPTLLSQTKGRSLDDDFLIEEVPARSYRTAALADEPKAAKTLGQQLSRARRAANLTQQQLAEATGINQPFICAIEKGTKNPTLETMEILARGCGRTLRISLE